MPQTAKDTACPWCGSKSAPIRTDVSLANFQGSYTSIHIAVRQNPMMCPECYGVGGYEDWGL